MSFHGIQPRMSRPYVPRSYPKYSYYGKTQYKKKPTYNTQPSNYVLAKVANQAAAKGAALAVARLNKGASRPLGVRMNAAHGEHHAHKSHKAHHATGHDGENPKTHANSGIGRNIGQFAGSMIPGAGSVLGPALGWLGDKLEDGIGSLFGFGEYKVENNSLMAEGGNVVPEGGRPPMVNNAYDHDGSAVVIRHAEPLGDIVTSAVAGDLKLQNFFIQPGLSQSFPWLGAMAQNFQQWKPRGILYEFRSMAADAISGTNIALGTVTMATNYNSSAPNFTSKKDMQNSEYATSTKPSLSVFHPIECDSKVSAQEVLYIRNAAVPEGDDQRLYDWGNFQIATSGFQGASVTIGELWVTYEIELIKPKSVSTVGSYIMATHLAANNAVASTPFLGAVPYSGATLNTYVIGGGTTLCLDNASGLQIGQRYKVDLYFASAAGPPVAMSSPAVAFNGCVTLTRFNNSSGTSAYTPTNGASTNRMSYSWVIEITTVDFDPSIQFNATTLPSNCTMDVFITQIPSLL